MGEVFSPPTDETSITVIRLPNGWYVLRGKVYDGFSQVESVIVPKDLNATWQINVRPPTLEEKADWMTRIAMGEVKPQTIYRDRQPGYREFSSDQ